MARSPTHFLSSPKALRYWTIGSIAIELHFLDFLHECYAKHMTLASQELGLLLNEVLHENDLRHPNRQNKHGLIQEKDNLIAVIKNCLKSKDDTTKTKIMTCFRELSRCKWGQQDFGFSIAEILNITCLVALFENRGNRESDALFTLAYNYLILFKPLLEAFFKHADDKTIYQFFGSAPTHAGCFKNVNLFLLFTTTLYYSVKSKKKETVCVLLDLLDLAFPKLIRVVDQKMVSCVFPSEQNQGKHVLTRFRQSIEQAIQNDCLELANRIMTRLDLLIQKFLPDLKEWSPQMNAKLEAMLKKLNSITVPECDLVSVQPLQYKLTELLRKFRQNQSASSTSAAVVGIFSATQMTVSPSMVLLDKCEDHSYAT